MRRAGNIPVAVTDAEEAMRIAIEATRDTYPHPNPRVGAVLVSPDGDVIAVASHAAAGTDHAEILALKGTDDAKRSTLYVTLEPCNHHGRTPPCTEAIIDAGVTKVVVGSLDPDPRVSGSGVQRLREGGVSVDTGVLTDDVVSNDPGYFHHRTTGLPLVTAKLATTLDGQAGAVDGTSQWITSPEARMDAHRLRAENDVVIIGAGTVVADDPALTVRIDGYKGPQPRPVIIAGKRELPASSRVLERDPIIYRPDGHSRVDPVHVVKDLGALGVVTAMIEGGPSVLSDFLRSGVVDRLVWYIGAKLANGTGIPALPGVFETIEAATALIITDVRTVGPDVRITATVAKDL